MIYRKPEIEELAGVLLTALAASNEDVSGIGNEQFSENGEYLDIEF